MDDKIALNSYHGELVNSRFVSGLNLIEAIYPARMELPRHSHNSASLCLILQGAYVESYGSLSLECKPSTVKFQPIGEVHSNRYGDRKVRSFIIELQPHWLGRMTEGGLRVNCPMVLQDGALSLLIMKLRKESLCMDTAAPIVIEGLMLEAIAQSSRNQAGLLIHDRPRWLQRAKEILHEQFTERLTLSIIADSVGVHPMYLANTFRRHYNCSIGEYLRRLRVEAACEKLSKSGVSLVDIAMATGFSHQSHFSRVFKQVTGFTPAQYRKMFATP